MRIDDNLYVKIIDFPNSKVKGCITQNEDGTYTIFINAKLSQHQQALTLKHELNHFYKDDFEKENVNEIELNNV